MAFILGSGSPRRLQLLAQLGVHPDAVRPPETDETPRKGELPRDYCTRVTREKTQAVPAGTDDIVLCADTTVALGRRILGKPRDAGEAAEFLLALSGRRHRVITAVAVRRGDRIWEKDVVSQVKMKNLSDEELNAYLATGDWEGKVAPMPSRGPLGRSFHGSAAPSPELSGCRCPKLPIFCAPPGCRCIRRPPHEGPHHHP